MVMKYQSHMFQLLSVPLFTPRKVWKCRFFPPKLSIVCYVVSVTFLVSLTVKWLFSNDFFFPFPTVYPLDIYVCAPFYD
jgi:hypothetical protein